MTDYHQNLKQAPDQIFQVRELPAEDENEIQHTEVPGSAADIENQQNTNQDSHQNEKHASDKQFHIDYLKNYDLNVLWKMAEDGHEIERKELDFADNKQLSFFL